MGEKGRWSCGWAACTPSTRQADCSRVGPSRSMLRSVVMDPRPRVLAFRPQGPAAPRVRPLRLLGGRDPGAGPAAGARRRAPAGARRRAGRRPRLRPPRPRRGRSPSRSSHTNDHHGHAWASQSKGGRVGGLAARAALVARIRAEVAAQGGHVLLVDAGDFNTGSYCSDELKAEPDLAAYRRMGYQAVGARQPRVRPALRRAPAPGRAGRLPAAQRQRGAARGRQARPRRRRRMELRRRARGGHRAHAARHGHAVDEREGPADPVPRPAEDGGGARAGAPRARARGGGALPPRHARHPEARRPRAGDRRRGVGHDHMALHRPLKAGTTTIVQAGSEGPLPRARGPRGPGDRARRRSRPRGLYPVGADLPEDRAVAESLAGYRKRCTGDEVGRTGWQAAAGRDDHVAGVEDALAAGQPGRRRVPRGRPGGRRLHQPGRHPHRPARRPHLAAADPRRPPLRRHAHGLHRSRAPSSAGWSTKSSRREPGGQGALFPAGVRPSASAGRATSTCSAPAGRSGRATASRSR
ncbi:MAG: hypothetical protein M0C28_07815 [Candidatus Moduliflexus flocculans]|nr:hypothetical protein [Candidatus Moduliflexus flocculans]